jgi:putative transposase
MSAISSLLLTAGVMLRALCEIACYACRFAWTLMLPRARLVGRVLAAESQLAIELDRTGGRKHRRQFTPAFRLLRVALSKLLDGWEGLAHLMKPQTVTRWHRRAFPLLWRWRSRLGRPPLPDEMQQLIRRLSRENPLWGPDRIRDVLGGLHHRYYRAA